MCAGIELLPVDWPWARPSARVSLAVACPSTHRNASVICREYVQNNGGVTDRSRGSPAAPGGHPPCSSRCDSRRAAAAAALLPCTPAALGLPHPFAQHNQCGDTLRTPALPPATLTSPPTQQTQHAVHRTTRPLWLPLIILLSSRGQGQSSHHDRHHHGDRCASSLASSLLNSFSASSSPSSGGASTTCAAHPPRVHTPPSRRQHGAPTPGQGTCGGTHPSARADAKRTLHFL
jgi:hypothetical protein